MACVCESGNVKEFCTVCKEYVDVVVDFTNDGDYSSKVCEGCIRKSLAEITKREGEKVFVVEYGDYDILWRGVVSGTNEKEIKDALNAELPKVQPLGSEVHFYVTESSVKPFKELVAEVKARAAHAGGERFSFEDENFQEISK